MNCYVNHLIAVKRKICEMTKRRLYKETPTESLNEDGTRKTLKQQVDDLNRFVQSILQRDISDENN
jgi:hypothetical protein